MSKISWQILSEGKQVVTPRGEKIMAMAHNEDMFGVRSYLPAGTVKDFQQHPPVQYYIVISGKMEVTIGDETKMMTAGDTAIVPANVRHKVVALEDTVELEVFNDPRKDVLEKWFS